MRSKLILVLLAITLCVSSLHAQASTRPASVGWNASNTTGVVGYNLYRCTVPTGSTTCTPTVTSTPLNGTTLITGLFWNDTPTIGNLYVYGVVAVANPCGPTSPLNVACGSSAIALSSLVPVPLQPGSATTITIIMP